MCLSSERNGQQNANCDLCCKVEWLNETIRECLQREKGNYISEKLVFKIILVEEELNIFMVILYKCVSSVSKILVFYIIVD